MRRLTLLVLAIAALAGCKKINLFATGRTSTQSLTIWAEDSTLAVGEHVQFHSDKGPGLRWQSSNSRVASVSSGGVVRGQSAGQAMVSGEWSDGAVGGATIFVGRILVTVVP